MEHRCQWCGLTFPVNRLHRRKRQGGKEVWCCDGCPKRKPPIALSPDPHLLGERWRVLARISCLK